MGSSRKTTSLITSCAIVFIWLSISSCSFEPNGDETFSDVLIRSPTPTSDLQIDGIPNIPEEARASTGGGDPRPPAYWTVWNSCAPDNRADLAANGGREAGWVLVDDLLEDPGIALGDHLLTSCDESLALLLGQNASGEETGDPIYDLAGQLLAAELNLNVGAETCPAAEEAVLAAHILLSSNDFDGQSSSPLDSEAGGALNRITDLLRAYNSGTLCR
jgi:hypothetical protein